MFECQYVCFYVCLYVSKYVVMSVCMSVCMAYLCKSVCLRIEAHLVNQATMFRPINACDLNESIRHLPLNF